MSIGISEEHTGLADSLRGWAASVGGVEAARAAEGDADAAFEDAWKGVVEMGLATIAVPESVGGGGGTTLDQAVALESCASELVAGPLLGPAIAACVLTRAGHTAGLGALADGSVVSLGLAGADGTVLLDAPSAQQALLRGPAGWVLAPVDSLAVTPATGLDMSRRAGSVTGDVAGGVAGEPVGVDDGTVRRTAVTLAAAVPMVRVFVHSAINSNGLPSMPMALSVLAADAAGQNWPVIAPFIGALGSFLSGSATFSNMTFALFQFTAANQAGLPPETVLGAQILGASAGNMVSVVNVVAAAAVVGRVGREGEIIRVTLVPMLAYTAAVGLVAAAAIGFAR